MKTINLLQLRSYTESGMDNPIHAAMVYNSDTDSTIWNTSIPHQELSDSVRENIEMVANIVRTHQAWSNSCRFWIQYTSETPDSIMAGIHETSKVYSFAVEDVNSQELPVLLSSIWSQMQTVLIPST